MRIRIDQPNKPGVGPVFIIPVDPPIPFDISSLFELVSFTAPATSAPPFARLAVNWTIQPIDQSTRVEDYQFRLGVFGHVQLNSIQTQGSAPFTLLSNTMAVISGRKNGGAWSSFDQKIIISLDESNYQVIDHFGPFLDDLVFGDQSVFF